MQADIKFKIKLLKELPFTYVAYVLSHGSVYILVPLYNCTSIVTCSEDCTKTSCCMHVFVFPLLPPSKPVQPVYTDASFR